MIKQKIINLSTLDTDILAKVDSVLDSAASMMEQRLGKANYANYLALPDDDKDNPKDSAYIPYQSLDDNGRIKRMLEEAEAHLALANLVFAGKKQYDEDVLLNSETFGKGSFYPADMSELQKLSDYHIAQADAIIGAYLDSISEGNAGNGSIRFYVLAEEVGDE